jgi:hypothetical protein
MANTIGEKELRTDWPFEEGLTAGTTKQRDDPHLEPEEDLTVGEHWGSL